MNAELLQAVGLTEDEIQERVIDKIVERVLAGEEEDYGFSRMVKERVQKRIDDAVKDAGDKYVQPKVGELIESVTLQQTNKWGEKTGTPVTFVEYIVQRAEGYMTETVDSHGKSKAESDYSWSGTQTRMTQMINQHLHYHIETAMKAILQNANSVLVKGIEGAVKAKLEEMVAKMKVGVDLGR